MEIIRTVARLKEALDTLRSGGNVKVGLVPTMGALHAGHMSLVERSCAENDVTVVSVFVNPTQFNNPDDLRTYPRTEEADCTLLEKAGVDIAFVPSVEEVYPEPDTRKFDLGAVAEVMEGAMRPGHFNGVAQVVSRLFELSEADRAYFGEKDYQQIAVIRRMAQVMGLQRPQIVACPIQRPDDGLALSSRNVRLSDAQRAEAPLIHRTLRHSVDMAAGGATVAEVKAYVLDTLSGHPMMEPEYYEIVHPHTLQPVDSWAEGATGCVTVWMGDVRLIDNIKYPAKN